MWVEVDQDGRGDVDLAAVSDGGGKREFPSGVELELLGGHEEVAGQGVSGDVGDARDVR